MAVASVSKVTAASAQSFDAAVREGLKRASKTLRGITGLHVVEQKASVSNGKGRQQRQNLGVPRDDGGHVPPRGLKETAGGRGMRPRSRCRPAGP